jgi:hypothetical protein
MLLMSRTYPMPPGVSPPLTKGQHIIMFTIINWLISERSYADNKYGFNYTTTPPITHITTTVSGYLTRHTTYPTHSLRYNQSLLKLLSALIGSYAQLHHTTDPYALIRSLHTTPIPTPPSTYTSIIRRYTRLTTTYTPTAHLHLIHSLYAHLTHTLTTPLPTPGTSSTEDVTPWA